MTDIGDPTPIKELEPSALGSKSHWDDVYAEELEHYSSDGIPGEDWFGPTVKTKIVRYLTKCSDLKLDDGIVDLGCGSGPVLTELYDAGFTNLTGVDYSKTAIELCKAVCETSGIRAHLQVFDLVDGPVQDLGKFRVCIDKGTYDAVSLIPTTSQTAARNKYLENVLKLMNDNSIFCIVSCNWTLDELRLHVKDRFKIRDHIPTTKFSFGGHTGNDVTILVLEKLT